MNQLLQPLDNYKGLSLRNNGNIPLKTGFLVTVTLKYGILVLYISHLASFSYQIPNI
jgi:hypothetical protein